MNEIKRKGARSTKDIPTEILAQLNRGEIETANLVEWLAVDQRLLLGNLLIENQRANYLKPILSRIDQLKKQTVNTINEAIGTVLFEQATQNNDKEFLAIISKHNADLVRCWATYTIGKNEKLNITEMLKQIQPFSADKHFGVREICWLAVRARIAQNLTESIEVLSKWTSNQDENIRRFTTEATRPRGVWCEHIEELKQNPEVAIRMWQSMAVHGCVWLNTNYLKIYYLLIVRNAFLIMYFVSFVSLSFSQRLQSFFTKSGCVLLASFRQFPTLS